MTHNIGFPPRVGEMSARTKGARKSVAKNLPLRLREGVRGMPVLDERTRRIIVQKATPCHSSLRSESSQAGVSVVSPEV